MTLSVSVLNSAREAAQKVADEAAALHEVHKTAAMRWVDEATPAINSRLAGVLETAPDMESIRDLIWVLTEDSNYEALMQGWDSRTQIFILDSALEGLPIRVHIKFPSGHGYRKFNKKVVMTFTALAPVSGKHCVFTSLVELGVLLRAGR